MGFTNEYTEVNVGVRTDKYYESLGYTIPIKISSTSKTSSRGLTMMIKTKDITKGSSVFVDYNCDCCDKLLHIKMNDYSNHNHDGEYYCPKCAAKLFTSGENSPNWNPNKTNEERENGRDYPEYREFVRTVMARDKGTCICCGKPANVVHHFNSYDWYIEGRVDPENAGALCDNCHSNFHTTYGFGKNSLEQFEEWFGRTIELVKNNISIPPVRMIYNFFDNQIYSAEELRKKYKTTSSPYNACNKEHTQFNGMILIWNDIYEKMTEEEIEAYKVSKDNSGIRVKCICLETLQVFDSYNKAAEWCGGNISDIREVCDLNKARKTSGKLQDGTYLHWMKYDDYLNSTPQQIEDVLYSGYENTKPVILLNTGEIFDSAINASKKYNMSSANINDCCRNNRICKKTLNGIPMRWVHYTTFRDMSDPEKQKIYEAYKESLIEDSFLFEKMNQSIKEEII